MMRFFASHLFEIVEIYPREKLKKTGCKKSANHTKRSNQILSVVQCAAWLYSLQIISEIFTKVEYSSSDVIIKI